MSARLAPGERVTGAETLHGGITADMRKLTIRTRDGGTRALVLRSYVGVPDAEESLARMADALTRLAGTAVPAPGLVAADPKAAHCAYPSLLMTHLPGRTFLTDEGLPARVPLLARQLVAIHALRPDRRLSEYVAYTTPDTVVTPRDADPAVWGAAVDLLRRTPEPPYEGRFMHRDFHPGNVLFEEAPAAPEGVRITGVVDWAQCCRGPADRDVAHCSTNLALLHGRDWGLRFAEAYEAAGGVLAATASERRYWRVRDALSFSEDLSEAARPWREAGRTELTTRAVEDRLNAYLTALMDGEG
ncbi:phosphotransferase [Streptomyces sp. NPDC093085]|uniref:phosphotransferase family protein n=1 Tax=Streptomyces sp. NPDC093085 TaxID=3155068 RepID=UPI0034299549